ncbi:NAD(P)-dependent dehydrogenase (short-subunit alcohol dehydrogenase family) [Kribbella shirazensis]|uniref:NAD(P)-dependent dehydrogenase (Short-subunit alcohol dehydrogenase family) n=1 Tax=Kribbella shirazensis TaxID=1105143 RepID=A0A7X6A655_9ACTN|nr:NAD(P)-dependent dehydrogenase (short-subunit alcohol dehydrogenase family) [Kribbella shirazensis]
MDLEHRGAVVNAVAPGAIQTPPPTGAEFTIDGGTVPSVG